MEINDVVQAVEKVLHGGMFKFACEPHIKFVKETNKKFCVRIMWGFENEGIEFIIPQNVKNLENEIALRLDKELNGIYHYSKVLYKKIICE